MFFETPENIDFPGYADDNTPYNLPVDIHITNTKISNVERVKLLGVNIEGSLNFDYHVNTLVKKANKKYHALARACYYMDTKK